MANIKTSNILNSRDLLPSLLNQLKLNGSGVEIGVAHGKFSEIWIPASHLSEIFLIDPWKEYDKGEYMDGNNHPQLEQDNRYHMVIEKMKKYGDRVRIIRDESLQVVSQFADGYFDFIYIDANHEYKWVKKDLEAWYPKLRKGGVFSGHDYVNIVSRRKNRFGENSICGVKQAVDEFSMQVGAVIQATGGSRRCPPSWYFIK